MLFWTSFSRAWPLSLRAANVAAVVLIPLASIWNDFPWDFWITQRDIFQDKVIFFPSLWVGRFCTTTLVLSWIWFVYALTSMHSQVPMHVCLCGFCDTEHMRQWLLSPHRIPRAVLGKQQTNLVFSVLAAVMFLATSWYLFVFFPSCFRYLIEITDGAWLAQWARASAMLCPSLWCLLICSLSLALVLFP